MKKEILRLENASWRCKANASLKKISMSLYEGELLSIMGLSSSGIDILPKILSGEVMIGEGKLYLNGTPVSSASVSRFQQEHHIYCLNASCALFPEFSIAENFTAIRKISPASFFLNRKKAYSHTQYYLDFAGLPLDASMPAGRITEAQAHLVQIMKFVSQGAKIIILDRIATLSSAQDFSALLHLIRRLKQVSFIYIGTQPDLMAELSDRILVLRGGYAAGVIHHDLYNGNLLFSMMTKRQPKKMAFSARLHPGRDTVLRINALPVGKSRLSCCVHGGEILGIADYTGSLSKLEQMLFPPRRSAEDILWVDGRGAGSLKKAVSLGLSFVNGASASHSYINSFTLPENLSFQLLGKSPFNVKKRVSEHIYHSCIGSFSDAELKSRGQSFDLKTLLFRCLYSRPSAMIINHITALLDPLQSEELLSIVRRIASEGIGILFISPEISHCYSLCSRILCPTRRMGYVEIDPAAVSYQELLDFICLQHSEKTAALGAYLV